jgi:hypothetical protein
MDLRAVVLRRFGLVVLLVVSSWPLPARGESAAAPQHATPDDVRVFDPYIGRFKSEQQRDEESGKTFHYIAEYAWFDQKRSIVKFTISVVNEASGKQAVTAQGFYGYDPFEERLFVFGAFATGSSGFGSVGEFDRKTHRRVTWARSKAPDGATIHVRDAFEPVDSDTWKDVTSVRQGDDGPWKVVYQDTFTRIED